MMTEDENATLVMLAKAATRGSASYEYEIDTLRGALRTLFVQALQSSVNDPANEWGMEALEAARVAIERTDWIAP